MIQIFRRLCVSLVLVLGVLASQSGAVETAVLSNLSVRTALGANQTLIVGGVINGGSKNVLVRAAGPALVQFGLPGMADPQLALFTTGTVPLATNDNWPLSLAGTFTSVGAFAFDANSRDAALVQSLNGPFTVQVAGPNAGTVLVEAYDVAGGLSPRMINLSARNRVGLGADVLIAGFTVSGTGTKALLIRGIGPGLASFNVPGTLADPLLRVFDSRGTVIDSNDNWAATLASTMATVGAFPLPANSKDAALVTRLAPGSYSVQISGADGGTGDGIVEVYEIPDPTTAPDAPAVGAVVAGNAQVTVSFTPPASNGGAPITRFTVTSSPGGLTATGASSPLTVTGLTNGTAYTFTVTATNAAGTGAASGSSILVTPIAPASVAGAPNIGTATAGNGQASVTFTPPASSGGSAITSYTVTSSPGGLTATGASSPLAVTGLTNGTAYTFTVTATNAAGTSAASGPSNAVTPIGTASVAGAPNIGTATPGNGQASVAFTPPASNGGSAITSYTVTSNPGGLTATGASSPLIVTGLTNGTTYTFTVRAGNAAGVGNASAPSNAVTPAAVPGAPTIGTATAGNAQASVTFTPPASNGGATITSYTATSSPGGLTATGTASPLVVTGLSNGTTYTFTVTATNSSGAGAASGASNSVTPAALPSVAGAPTMGTATAGNGQASVTFAPPAVTGGSLIAGYTVTATPGGLTATGLASPLTVIGLTNGISYTFTVTATNATGVSAPSAASNAVTPASVPGAPVIGLATAGTAQASVTFTAPASNGGAPITGFTATSNPGGFTATGPSSPLTITGLAGGTSYTFTVTATNSTGAGAASAPSNAVTPGVSLTEARLPNTATFSNNVALGFPRMSPALPSIGSIRIKVIFVDFSDAPASVSRTPQSVFGLISPGSENLWNTLSYGKLSLTLDPSFVWLRMSKPSAQYFPFNTNAAHKVYVQEAVNLALAAGVSFSASDSVAVMANPDATAISNGPTFLAGSVENGITAGSKTFTVAITSGSDLLVWGFKWLNHEGGHMMGLADLYAFSGSAHRFVGNFSLMGLISGTAPEYLGWERWLLGWLDDNQVLVASRGTASYTLTPIETASGTKLLVIPTGPTTAVVVEYRRPIGFDTALVKAGPLVYFIDTSIPSGGGVVKVLPLDDADTTKNNKPLNVGQTLTFNGVSVTCVSANATNTTLQVVRP